MPNFQLDVVFQMAATLCDCMGMLVEDFQEVLIGQPLDDQIVVGDTSIDHLLVDLLVGALVDGLLVGMILVVRILVGRSPMIQPPFHQPPIMVVPP
jgi:hypothetical protein